MSILQTHSTDLELSSSQYWSLSTPSSFPTGSNSRTIECWIKPETLPTAGATMYVFDVGEDGTNDSEFTLAFKESSGSYFGFCDFYNRATTGTADLGFTTGTYYHFAVTYDGTDLKYYVDGVLKDTVDDGGTVNTVNNLMAIGTRINNVTPQNGFDGLVDDVRIWSDVRTSAEIDDNKSNCDLSTSAAGLVSWWLFNNDGTDETATGNDLTNNNSATFVTDVPYTCTALGENALSMCNF